MPFWAPDRATPIPSRPPGHGINMVQGCPSTTSTVRSDPRRHPSVPPSSHAAYCHSQEQRWFQHVIVFDCGGHDRAGDQEPRHPSSSLLGIIMTRSNQFTPCPSEAYGRWWTSACSPFLNAFPMFHRGSAVPSMWLPAAWKLFAGSQVPQASGLVFIQLPYRVSGSGLL